jgi:hypothetical protein
MFTNKTVTLDAADEATDWINAGARHNSAGIVAFQLSATGWTGTITFQARLDPTDDTNVVPIAAVEVADPATASTTASAGAKIWRVDTAGGVWVRAKCTAYTAGSMQIKIAASDG